MTKKRKVTNNNNWVVSKLEGKENAFLYSSSFLGFDAGETVKIDKDHTFEAELKVSEMLLYQETEEECDKPVPLGEKKLLLTDSQGNEHHVFLTDIPEFLTAVPEIKHGVVRGTWGFKYDSKNETYGLRYVGKMKGD